MKYINIKITTKDTEKLLCFEQTEFESYIEQEIKNKFNSELSLMDNFNIYAPQSKNISAIIVNMSDIYSISNNINVDRLEFAKYVIKVYNNPIDVLKRIELKVNSFKRMLEYKDISVSSIESIDIGIKRIKIFHEQFQSELMKDDFKPIKRGGVNKYVKRT